MEEAAKLRGRLAAELTRAPSHLQLLQPRQSLDWLWLAKRSFDRTMRIEAPAS
jgi:hypothetical protein